MIDSVPEASKQETAALFLKKTGYIGKKDRFENDSRVTISLRHTQVLQYTSYVLAIMWMHSQAHPAYWRSHTIRMPLRKEESLMPAVLRIAEVNVHVRQRDERMMACSRRFAS